MILRHTVVAKAPKPNPRPDGAQNVAQYTPGISVRGLLYPEAQSAVFERFGVELAQPYVFYCLASSGREFPMGGRVDFGGRTFAVRAPARVFASISAADHAEILLEEVAGVADVALDTASAVAGSDPSLPVSEDVEPI